MPVAREADARYSRAGSSCARQFAQVWIDNADLNDALGSRIGVDPNIASALRGFYARGRLPVVSRALASATSARSRATRTSTRSTDAGRLRAAAEFDRDAWVVGANYWPDPDIAVKVDYSIVGNRSSVIARRTRSTSAWDGGSDAQLVQRGSQSSASRADLGSTTVAATTVEPTEAGAGRARDRDHRRAVQPFTPSEIQVKAGTTLEIRLRSDDTAHGFRIVGTDVDIELRSADAATRP